MQKTLEKKLRKMFRKKQREYRWLGFDENAYKLIDSLPLRVYRELEEELTDEEFHEFMSVFMEFGKEKILFAILPSDAWIKRCCSSSKVFDVLSDNQLKETLKCADDILKLFLAINEERQCRLMSILNEEMLENFMYYIGEKDCNTINQFLVWLCVKEENEVRTAKQEEIANIFRKIGSLSDSTMAKILEDLDARVMRRMLEEIRKTGRDLLSICKQIRKDMLYLVVSKSNFALLEYADSGLYSWFYANLTETARTKFLEYLAENLEKVEFFDAEICAGIFALDNCHKIGWKRMFVMEVFKTRSAEEFDAFYEKLSLDQKEEMFEKVLLIEEGKEVVKACLKDKHNLGLLEKLVNEKYVTD